MTEKKMTRRTFLSRLMGLGLAAAGIGRPLYSYYIERQWLNIHRITLPFAQLPSSFDGMRIVHFSDLHIGFFFGEEQMRKVADLIELEEADLICFTGDLVDHQLEELPSCIPHLRRLKARYGKYAVMGNHDYAEAPAIVHAALKEGGFRVLMNESVLITRGSDSLALAGMEDALHASPDPVKALTGIDPGTFTLMLMHEANMAEVTAQYPVQLQLSGHSHGGQIRLPWIGHIVTPPMGDRYVDRWNLVSGSELQVYTNRGIGTTGIPIRFLCRPEITVIKLTRTDT
jgi:predicted MPP superfamily phosphohydrolase